MTIRVEGLREINEILKTLPNTVERRVLTASLMVGARIIAKSAREKLRANPSVDSGLLVNSVVVRSKKGRKRDGYLPVVQIGASRKLVMVRRKGREKTVEARPSKYAHLVEFGTKHMKAEPFLRPALDEKAVEAIRAIGEAMARRIEAESVKLAAGKISFSTGKRVR